MKKVYIVKNKETGDILAVWSNEKAAKNLGKQIAEHLGLDDFTVEERTVDLPMGQLKGGKQ